MRVSEFRIITKNGPIDEKIYYDEVGAYTIKNLQISKLDEKVLNQENPRRIVGQDKVFLEKLILLLERGLEERVQREIISLITVLPVNKELKLLF